MSSLGGSSGTSGGDEGGECGVCGAGARLRCGGCGQMYYCGREHQRQHWPRHKTSCPSYRLTSSPSEGRFLVSTRRIGAGQMVLEEAPVVVGPPSMSPLICLACHRLIPGPDIPRCQACWWPMCSPPCDEAPRHQSECAVLARDTKHIAAPTSLDETIRYDVILTLRCLLLRELDPPGWTKLLTMAHHSELRKANEDLDQMTTVKYLSETLKLDYPEDQVHQVKGAISTNALEIRSKHNTRLRGMYPLVALFNHACSPNIHVSSGTDDVMQARVAHDVEGDTKLCICYTGTLVPLWERQHVLSSYYYFFCECARCTDPTEMGTHFSSPRCLDCIKGFLEATVRQGSITWRCSNCCLEVSNDKVKGDVTEWLEPLRKEDLIGGTFKQATALLKEVEQVFHPTHYAWMKTAQEILFRMRTDSSYDAMQLRRQIWHRLTDLYCTLEPGITKRRGMSLLETGLATLHEAKRQLQDNSYYLPTLVGKMRPLLEMLAEAAEILRREPEGSRLKPMVEVALERRSEVQHFLDSVKTEETQRSE